MNQVFQKQHRFFLVPSKKGMDSNLVLPPNKDAPILMNVEPDNGPESGGTNVTIYGQNLGQNATDLKSVLIAQEVCDPFGWVNSSQIWCITPASKAGGKASILVITESGGSSGEDPDLKFTYNLGTHWSLGS